MINVNTITEKLSLPKFEVPKVDLPKIAMPRIDLTNLDLAKIDLPKFDLPKFDLPKFDLSRATELARDAAYIGVGAVVVSVQTADERRRTVTEQISGQLRKVVGTTD